MEKCWGMKPLEILYSSLPIERGGMVVEVVNIERDVRTRTGSRHDVEKKCWRETWGDSGRGCRRVGEISNNRRGHGKGSGTRSNFVLSRLLPQASMPLEKLEGTAQARALITHCTRAFVIPSAAEHTAKRNLPARPKALHPPQGLQLWRRRHRGIGNDRGRRREAEWAQRSTDR